ncbi:MAG: preprotein translocase subunit YajC, partial [Paludibacteraceae bacterium]|nr:preprotein translocase subunit YajC [Paludibacteraceae bacterium]
MTNLVLLQAQGGASAMGSIFMMVAIFAIMYFFMIRPQQKKQKEIQQFRASLGVGSKVVTGGGIHGVIKEINDVYAMIEIAQGVKVKVDLNSVFPSVDSGVK